MIVRRISAASAIVFVGLMLIACDKSTPSAIADRAAEIVRPDYAMAKQFIKEADCEALGAHSYEKAKECLEKLKRDSTSTK